MPTYHNIIAGNATQSTHYQTIYNPADGSDLGQVSISTSDEVQAAVAAAKQAQPAWAERPDHERCHIIRRVAAIIQDNSEYLARLLTQEQGKPLSGPGSRFELQACVGWTQVPADLQLPPVPIFADDQREDVLHYVPRGVVAAIAPWNWPLMIAIWQIIPALRMGNTVVLKPSEYTPIATLELVRLIHQALPPGILNTVTGDGVVGQTLVQHPDINKIMFTGSEATGRKIIQASANNLAPTTLELGGNDGAIILPGTTLKTIANDLFWGAFLNMGQTCACIKRLYVHEADYPALLAELSTIAAELKIGNGLDETVLIGPLQNRQQLSKVTTLLQAAKDSGCAIHQFGTVPDKGYFLPITLVGDIQDGHPLVDEEQFGPVLPIIRYQQIEQAIAAVNQSKFGLGASLWTDDPAKATSLALALQAGTVWINQHGAIHPMVPFGGNKSSGFGLEFGLAGLKAVCQSRVISRKKA